MNCHCCRCGYDWSANYHWRKHAVRRVTERPRPKKCARCKSPLWNTPRRRSGYGSKYSEASR